MGVKNLVIAPHADDEVLGCGGVLGKNSFVYICGIDESRLAVDETPANKRLECLKKVADFYGFQFEINTKSKVNYYDLHDFIDIFEKLINKLEPESIFIPCPDYNQDHKAIYNAAYIALRPHDKNFFVKKVLLYETSHNAVWNPRKLNLNYFVTLDIEKKLKAYAMYETEVRAMRSPDMIRDIARLRGKAINQDYAEAFEILRWVD